MKELSEEEELNVEGGGILSTKKSKVRLTMPFGMSALSSASTSPKGKARLTFNRGGLVDVEKLKKGAYAVNIRIVYLDGTPQRRRRTYTSTVSFR